MLEIREVTKRYGTAEDSPLVLDKISLDLGQSEFVSIVGASGCGKTTLLKIVGGLLPPTSGDVFLDGDPVKRPIPDKTAIVFQEDALLPWFRVEENVAIGLAAQGKSRHERHEQVREELRKVGLEGHRRAYPHQLSGGMRQRVALARGLVMEPRLLLLDEPFASLDEQTRNLMGAELRALHHRVGGAMVMVTHSLTEAVLLSDRVVALSAHPGRLRSVIDIPLPSERDVDLIDTAQFVELRHLLWAELQEDWLHSMERGDG
jgi:NitT/TauT family transport system ATP-binding protein